MYRDERELLSNISDETIREKAKERGYNIEESHFGKKKLVNPRGLTILEPTTRKGATNRMREELGKEMENRIDEVVNMTATGSMSRENAKKNIKDLIKLKDLI